MTKNKRTLYTLDTSYSLTLPRPLLPQANKLRMAIHQRTGPPLELH